MKHQKPYRDYLIVTSPIEGNCYRSEVKNKNGDVIFDTYWLATYEGVPATIDCSIEMAEEWTDKLYA